MGLRDTLKSSAQSAFKAAGDIKEDVTYYGKGVVTYNTSTGVVNAQDSGYLISAIFSNYKNSQVDGKKILNTDVRMLLPQNDLPIEPAAHDFIIRLEANASIKYEALSIEKDPAGALWMIQLRKP